MLKLALASPSIIAPGPTATLALLVAMDRYIVKPAKQAEAPDQASVVKPQKEEEPKQNKVQPKKAKPKKEEKEKRTKTDEPKKEEKKKQEEPNQEKPAKPQ